MANGCRSFFYSGSQHVDGTLDHTEAEKVGKVYQEVEQFEAYLADREVSADVAIIQSDSSTMAKSGSRVVLNAIGRVRQPDPHKEALKGAMMLCDYAKYSWRIVPEQELTRENAGKFKCIVLAGTFHITEQLKEVLQDFKNQGGSILAAGECGLYEKDGTKRSNFALADILGCDYVETIEDYSDQQYGGYMKMDDHEIFKNIPETYPPMGNIQYKVKAVNGEKLGAIMNPCTKVTETTWVNWWCPPPKMNALESPALVKNGNCIYVAYDLFQTYQLNLNRNLFENIMRQCVEKPSIYLDTRYKETVSYCAYCQEEQLVIHVLSNLAEKTNGDAPEIEPGKLFLSKELVKGKKAFLVYPGNQELAMTEHEDYVEITLPKLSIHEMILLK